MKKVLIANRGEIAWRILRACRKLGMSPVVVYSAADASAPYLELADQKVFLGAAEASESYLNTAKIICAAQENGCEFIHPGYGFLAENADFAESVTKAGMKFVGPSAAAMRLAGNKDAARKLAAGLGLKLPQGYDGDDQSEAAILAAAEKLGFPLLIKAAAGGGGRGMRRAASINEVAAAAAAASREAAAFFGDGKLILERDLSPARHIEVQLIGDSHGNVFHVFDRDCSLQRRYQKVIEVGPASGIPENLREKILAAAVLLGKEIKLCGAATVEFLIPTAGPGDDFYFLEINPRIQVEHPVTEMITGLDLVELQLRAAAGEKLPLVQGGIKLRGTAVEARVCAENPAKNFQAATGIIAPLFLPQPDEALRFDHALAPGIEVTPYYDSLLLKVIAFDEKEAAAWNKLDSALSSLVIGGIDTNLHFLRRIIAACGLGRVFDTVYLDRELDTLSRPADCTRLSRAALAAYVFGRSIRAEPASSLRYFRLQKENGGTGNVLGAAESGYIVSAASLDLRFESRAQPKSFGNDGLSLSIDGEEFVVRSADDDIGIPVVYVGCGATSQIVYLSGSSGAIADGIRFQIAGKPAFTASQNGTISSGKVLSPLPGKILRCEVTDGQTVARGELLLVIESMKTEHTLSAPEAGVIARLFVVPGQVVKQSELLLEFALSA